MPADNPSRERILGRIKDALRVPTYQLDLKPIPLETIFPPIPNPLDRFLSECVANLTDVVRTANPTESAQALAKTIASVKPGEIFLQDAPELRNLLGALVTDRPLLWSSQGAPPESTQATVTLAEALVAQTGSLLTSSGCGGRGASITPPCHIVYARTSQLLPDISSALRFAQQKGLTSRWSFVGLITGSSRTADIEKILVQGAHGPIRVVLVLEDA